MHEFEDITEGIGCPAGVSGHWSDTTSVLQILRQLDDIEVYNIDTVFTHRMKEIRKMNQNI